MDQEEPAKAESESVNSLPPAEKPSEAKEIDFELPIYSTGEVTEDE